MKVATSAMVGVSRKSIFVAHHSTVPVRPLPSVAVMTDEVMLVSGFVDADAEVELIVGEVLVDRLGVPWDSTLGPVVVDGAAPVLEMLELLSERTGRSEILRDVFRAIVSSAIMSVPD